MALFSRRQQSESVPAGAAAPGEQPDSAASPAADRGEDAAARGHAQEQRGGEPAASVGISVSAFRSDGSAAPLATAPVPAREAAAPPTEAAPAVPRRAAPAEAPPPHETIPGLADNVLLRQALAALPTTPGAPDVMNVARQLLQGHVFARVLGDARALLAEGKPLPLAVAEHGDKKYMLVYTGGAALQDAVRADGDVGTSATGQPVLTVLRHALAGELDGVVIDNSSGPARAVLPRPVLQRLIDDADDALRVKTLLAAPRTAGTAAEVVSALADASLWVAVRPSTDGGPVGVAESRTAEGQRFLEVFSHPIEVLALGRGDHAAPLTAAQLASAVAGDAGLTGVIVDPGGPWMRLTRDDLAPLVAAA